MNPPLLDIAKALADEGRLRMLALLAHGELCLCQIVEVMRLTPSAISRQADILFRAGLVAKRKEGKWHYFRLATDSPHTAVREALAWVGRHLEDEPTLSVTSETVCCVREKDLAELTACYRK